ADADDVANGVDCDGKGELAHPSNQQIAPGPILVAECEAAIAAAGQGTNPVEGRKPLEQPIAVDPRWCGHLLSSLCEWRLCPMSAWGHQRTFCGARVMFAIPPKADMCGAITNVR